MKGSKKLSSLISVYPDLNQICAHRLPGFKMDQPLAAIRPGFGKTRESYRSPCSFSIPLKPILIVSDHAHNRMQWSRVVSEEQYETANCTSDSFLSFSLSDPFELSLIIVDTDHCSSQFFEHFPEFQKIYKETPVMFIGKGYITKAKAEGYPEYLVGCLTEFNKISFQSLVKSGLKVFQTIQEKSALALSVGIPVVPVHLLGVHPFLQQFSDEIENAISQDVPVFIEGERGTLKELVASQIHLRSSRTTFPYEMFQVTMGVRDLYEPYLFGIEPNTHHFLPEGQLGKLELIHRGTLFIDKIDNMHAPTQARLLSFIKTKVLYRVNASKPRMCDVRIICSGTSRFQKQVGNGIFSSELHKMLTKCVIHVPALREMIDSIPIWITVLSQWMSESIGRPTSPEFTSAAMEKLMHYPWPGNFDELVSLVRKIVYSNTNDVISADDIHFHDHTLPSLTPFVGITCLKLEQQFILETLNWCRGNRTSTAKMLGISEKTLYNKLKECE